MPPSIMSLLLIIIVRRHDIMMPVIMKKANVMAARPMRIARQLMATASGLDEASLPWTLRNNGKSPARADVLPTAAADAAKATTMTTADAVRVAVLNVA